MRLMIRFRSAEGAGGVSARRPNHVSSKRFRSLRWNGCPGGSVATAARRSHASSSTAIKSAGWSRKSFSAPMPVTPANVRNMTPPNGAAKLFHGLRVIVGVAARQTYRTREGLDHHIDGAGGLARGGSRPNERRTDERDIRRCAGTEPDL